MQFGNQVEWSIHCCSLIAGLPPGKAIPTKALAEFHGVPRAYLAKALQRLSEAGILTTSVGPKGGYTLAKSPSEITILMIVEAVEGPEKSFVCTEIRRNSPCGFNAPDPCPMCPIASIMLKADAAWRKELRAVTLASLGNTLGKVIAPEMRIKINAWLEQNSGKEITSKKKAST